MRRVSVLALLAAGLLLGSCTDDAPGTGDRPGRTTTSTTTTFTLAPAEPVVTVVVQEALPEAAPVEYEDLDYPDLTGGEVAGEILVALTPDFTDRHDLLLCAWVTDVGWSGCTATAATGGAPVPVAVAEAAPDADVHVVLRAETDDEAGTVSLRRLGVYPFDRVFLYDYKLLDVYETVSDVMTMQPFAAENYLEPIF